MEASEIINNIREELGMNNPTWEVIGYVPCFNLAGEQMYYKQGKPMYQLAMWSPELGRVTVGNLITIMWRDSRKQAVETCKQFIKGFVEGFPDEERI